MDKNLIFRSTLLAGLILQSVAARFSGVASAGVGFLFTTVVLFMGLSFYRHGATVTLLLIPMRRWTFIALCLGWYLYNAFALRKALRAKSVQQNDDEAAVLPEPSHAHAELGDAYLERDDLELATRCYERFAAESGDKEAAVANFLKVGARYYNREEYDHALALYERALEVDPDNPQANADIGWVLLAKNQPEDAIQSFEKALALNPPADVAEYALQGIEATKKTIRGESE